MRVRGILGQMQDPTARISSFRRPSRLFIGLTLAASVLAAACDPSASTRNNNTEVDSAIFTGRLTARYKTPTATATPGLTVQRMTNEGRPFGVFVPNNYDPSRKWPFAILLHGIGGSGEGMALEFSEFAEATGMIIVAPNSYFQTWDLIYSATRVGSAQFGPDRTFIDNLLKWSFDHFAIDSARVGIAGFDDGGIYSIWLGLKNGDLFSRVGAFSPCSNVPSTRTGVPLVFVSHGINDQVSPIDDCSREMVPRLEGVGYTVEYVEYPSTGGNGHFMTLEVMNQAIQFLARQ
jgi:phospholipase/carboxylesterase